jgi:hypothetical protein
MAVWIVKTVAKILQTTHPHTANIAGRKGKKLVLVDQWLTTTEA